MSDPSARSVEESGQWLPKGTITFLFSDIEGSTQLWEKYPDEMKSALAKHDSILKASIESNHGIVIKTTGDGFHAVFEKAIDAIHAAVQAQSGLRSAFGTSSEHIHIKSRMGIHTGEAELRDGDYYGQSLNRAARLMSVAYGEQTLLSAVTCELAREHLPKEFSLLDLGEHHLKGLTRAERIFQLNSPGLPGEFPALKTLNVTPNNLPLQLTSFIGREREIEAIRKLVAANRMVTLTGPGGTGKTRLSIEVGRQELSSFPYGVWLVELAPISDPASILQSIASVFNLRAQLGMPLEEIVNDYLRAKELLLILDNCEHLIEACALISEHLLRTGPRLKMIASSREPLGIPGETVYRVPSLGIPQPTQARREILAEYESVQLFVERARSANPKFELTDQNAASIAQICSRLDGIPLALELASARASIFSAEQIATRLDDRFKLLTGGSRNALPRQQTLRALIDWSYDMLTEEERVLFRRLSVFAGGWTFEAAEAICNDLDVLDPLTQLVNKSLVTVDEESGRSRYRLLETIRQYARDKLLEAGEAEQIRHLHKDYFVRFSEETAPYLDSAEVLDWIPRIDAEYDNLRAAFEWSLDHDVEASLRIVGSLAYFWFRRGHGAEGMELSNAAFVRAGQMPLPENEDAQRRQMMIRAKALQAAAFLAYSQGDNISAYKAGYECIALARQLGDIQLLATALAFSGSALLFEGEFEAARSRIDEAVAICRAAGDRFGLALALGMMAQAEMIINHNTKAAEEYERQAMEMGAEMASTWTGLMMYFGTGRGAMYRGDYALARERFAYCLPRFVEMKDEHRANMIHSELAHMDRYEGKIQQALETYRQTILVWQKLGHRAAVAHQLECFAYLAKAQEEPERAVLLFGAAESLREKINIHMQPHERGEYDREVSDLRAGMNEHSFQTLWGQGRALTMDEAVELALSKS
jgi:predicted ATPase/class 3 adenylate cyclase